LGVFLINLEGNDMSDIPTSEEIKARQQRIKDWPKTITIAIAEWEAMRLDAERFKFMLDHVGIRYKEDAGYYWIDDGISPPDELTKSADLTFTDAIDAARVAAIKEGN
jgi:hypothetical protein